MSTSSNDQTYGFQVWFQKREHVTRRHIALSCRTSLQSALGKWRKKFPAELDSFLRQVIGELFLGKLASQQKRGLELFSERSHILKSMAIILITVARQALQGTAVQKPRHDNDHVHLYCTARLVHIGLFKYKSWVSQDNKNNEGGTEKIVCTFVVTETWTGLLFIPMTMVVTASRELFLLFKNYFLIAFHP